MYSSHVLRPYDVIVTKETRYLYKNFSELAVTWCEDKSEIVCSYEKETPMRCPICNLDVN